MVQRRGLAISCQLDLGNVGLSCSDTSPSISDPPSSSEPGKPNVPPTSLPAPAQIQVSTSTPAESTNKGPPSTTVSFPTLTQSETNSALTAAPASPPATRVPSSSTQTLEHPTSSTTTLAGDMMTANATNTAENRESSSHINNTGLIVGIALGLVLLLLALALLVVVFVKRKRRRSGTRTPLSPKGPAITPRRGFNPTISYPELSQSHVPNHYANDVDMQIMTDNISGYPRPVYLEKIDPKQKIARRSGRVPAPSSRYSTGSNLSLPTSVRTRFTASLGTSPYKLSLRDVPKLPEQGHHESRSVKADIDCAPPTAPGEQESMPDTVGEAPRPQNTPTTVGLSRQSSATEMKTGDFRSLATFFSHGDSRESRDSHAMTERSKIYGMYARDSPDVSPRANTPAGLFSIGEGMEMKHLEDLKEHRQNPFDDDNETPNREHEWKGI